MFRFVFSSGGKTRGEGEGLDFKGFKRLKKVLKVVVKSRSELEYF